MHHLIIAILLYIILLDTLQSFPSRLLTDRHSNIPFSRPTYLPFELYARNLPLLFLCLLSVPPSHSSLHADRILRRAYHNNITIFINMGAPSSPLSGVYSAQGRPSYQHDRTVIETVDDTTVYAVADGHGSPHTGHLVSQFCATHLTSAFRSHNVLSRTASPHVVSTGLQSAIRWLDTACIQHTTQQKQYAGSTLCAVVRNSHTLHCANVGDSRAVLFSYPNRSNAHHHQDASKLSSPALVTPLSRDHVCTDAEENARITEAGGVVVGKLLNGYISMSRALGDDDLKTHRNITQFPVRGTASEYSPQLFTAEADVTRRRIAQNDAVCVIASDGVWNVLSNDTVAKIVTSTILRGGDAQSVSHAIVKKALAKRSRDNITAVAFFLHDIDGTRALVRQAATTSKASKKGKLGVGVGMEHRRGRNMMMNRKTQRNESAILSPVTPVSQLSGFEAETSSADTVDLLDDMDSCSKLGLDFGFGRKGVFACAGRDRVGDDGADAQGASAKRTEDMKKAKRSTARRPGAWRRRLTSSLKKS